MYQVIYNWILSKTVLQLHFFSIVMNSLEGRKTAVSCNLLLEFLANSVKYYDRPLFHIEH